MPDVRLKVDGLLYGGWSEIRIERAMDRLAGGFELAVSEKWHGQDTVRPIRPGAECQVLIDGEPVITGWVDDVGVNYDAGSHKIGIRGRDKAGDLVDSSILPQQTTLGSFDLLDTARRLCEPFGITVTAEIDPGPRFQGRHFNPGATIFEVLDELAKIRAALLISDGNGGLIITRASNERLLASLVTGVNVLACDASFSHASRFRDLYVAAGRSAVGEGDDISGLNIVAHARDDLIERHRPLYIHQQGGVDGSADAQRFADHERNVRFGRSQSLRYLVQGWHYAPGKLWPVNRLVRVQDSLLGLDDARLIIGVAYTLGEQGTTTELTLMPREAWELIPLPEKADNWDAL